MPNISVEPESGELRSEVEAINNKMKPVRGYVKSGNYEGKARNGSLLVFQNEDQYLMPVTGQIDPTQVHLHQKEPDAFVSRRLRSLSYDLKAFDDIMNGLHDDFE